mmetsp:Transcript_1720/g.4233  ORF Transcript_1720/g.4233 Transcript_1720/m.4233 type:complete len:245 (-) Transcript_1720:706-1440(-)
MHIFFKQIILSSCVIVKSSCSFCCCCACQQSMRQRREKAQCWIRNHGWLFFCQDATAIVKGLIVIFVRTNQFRPRHHRHAFVVIVKGWQLPFQQPRHRPGLPIMDARFRVRRIAVRVHAKVRHQRWPVPPKRRSVRFEYSRFSNIVHRHPFAWTCAARGAGRCPDRDVVIPSTAMIRCHQERHAHVVEPFVITIIVMVIFIILVVFTRISQLNVRRCEPFRIKAKTECWLVPWLLVQIRDPLVT